MKPPRLPHVIYNPPPTLEQRERIVEVLLAMRRDGELNGVWTPTHIGVPIREKGRQIGGPTMLSWRECGELTGVLSTRKPVVCDARYQSKWRRKA